MEERQNRVPGVFYMEELYTKAVRSVQMILRRRYHLTSSQAEQAVAGSPLKRIFETDGQMAAHTSNEDWARDVYEYWKKDRSAQEER